MAQSKRAAWCRRLGPLLGVVALMVLGLLFLLLPDDRARVHFHPSSFNWSAVPQNYPVTSIAPLPTGRPLPMPRVQYEFPLGPRDQVARARQRKVRDVFRRCWKSYKRYAWGSDELTPVNAGWETAYGGWGATLVDALDTLWIMDLRDEFYDAAAFAARLDWAATRSGTDEGGGIDVFETTIRYLGGLLAAYDLSGEKALLRKASELGEMLYAAFDTPNRMPAAQLIFTAAINGTQRASALATASSATSLSLEFTRLAQLTGNAKFFDAVDRVALFLQATQNHTRLPGLWPRSIDFLNGNVTVDNAFTLGADCDSLYEYFPKMHVLLGGLDTKYERLYRTAMDAAKKYLFFRPMVPDDSGGKGVLFAGDAAVGPLQGSLGALFTNADSAADDEIQHLPHGQHLACFSGGMLGLGGKIFGIEDHVAMGDRVARGCAWAYASFPTGIMPESFVMTSCDKMDAPCPWNESRWESAFVNSDGWSSPIPRGFSAVDDPRYLLRPEAIESVFLLYRMTGKKDLQDLAWDMFQSIIRATETAYANSAIANVTVTGETVKTDVMESFWLAETLKYFYLIFSSPWLISLDDFVFNTEGHPFRRPK
ncbi:hypothetical protein VTK73DRAFT_4207 [Phialemonium thermophilum]|uniref:alpha-1,2-Mannosidase n=1 Tax=Phialemonium thermophilum TaxID=223376 RepID=A0ABR3WVC4_9PEZI